MQKRSHRHRFEAKSTSSGRLLNLALLAIYTLMTAYLLFLVFAYQFLNFRFLNLLIAGVLGLIFVLTLGLTLWGRGKWLSRALLLAASLAVGGGILFARSAIDLTSNLNQTARFSQVDMAVVVAKDSPIEAIEQVGALLVVATDQDNANQLLSTLSEQGVNPQQEEIGSYQAAYEGILGDPSKAMVLNSAYISLLEGQDPEFSQKTRVLHTTTLTKEQPVAQSVADGDVFNVYISGIDTYGPITSVSRSDVNIIMTVNRKTKKVLLTTTPRDAYVAIAGGGQGQYDKLTHAGIYGVDASIGTLENLYGIKIDYYARLNFTSFMELIDLVGGVEVVNDQAFTSAHGQHYFPAGEITLTSDQALGFVRERYALEGGDADRGQNQMKVIAALMRKLSNTRSIETFNALIDQLGASTQTNMPLSVMMALVNQQLEAGGQYQISNQALVGTGSTGQLPSYAMPNAALYMVSIDEASLAASKQAIVDVMEGR